MDIRQLTLKQVVGQILQNKQQQGIREIKIKDNEDQSTALVFSHGVEKNIIQHRGIIGLEFGPLQIGETLPPAVMPGAKM